MHYLLLQGLKETTTLEEVRAWLEPVRSESTFVALSSSGKEIFVADEMDSEKMKELLSHCLKTPFAGGNLTASVYGVAPRKVASAANPGPKVLCYGDSLTYGSDPENLMGRIPTPWPKVFASVTQAEVIEEGCCGRTTCRDDDTWPVPHMLNGYTPLHAILFTHRPLDLAIIMLGTNDAKAHFNLTSDDIAEGIMKLVDVTRKPPAPITAAATDGAEGDDAILPLLVVINPSISVGTNEPGKFLKPIFEGAQPRLAGLPAAFEKALAAADEDVKKRVAVHVLDGVEVGADGVHFGEEAHAVMGEQISRAAVGAFPWLFSKLFR